MRVVFDGFPAAVPLPLSNYRVPEGFFGGDGFSRHIGPRKLSGL
jgi:hypothetical protein